MIPRGMREVADMWSLKTAVLAAVAVFGLTMSAQAQCPSGGQGGSGGQMSGRSTAGMGMGGAGMGSGSYSPQAAIVAAQIETAQYLYGIQASHNNMMQQVQQHNQRQLEGLRQASANRKRLAAQKAIEVSSKAKSKSSSSSSKAIELTQSN